MPLATASGSVPSALLASSRLKIAFRGMAQQAGVCFDSIAVANIAWQRQKAAGANSSGLRLSGSPHWTLFATFS
jgi:hypothetical protein